MESASARRGASGWIEVAREDDQWTVLGVSFSNENVWKLIAIGVCTFANFWLSSKLAFRDGAAEGDPAQSDSAGTSGAS